MNVQNRMTSISMEVAKIVLTTLAIATLMLGCSYATAVENPAQAAGPISSENYRGKPATGHTVRANAALEKRLPKGDFLDGSMMTDFNESTLVAPLPAVMGTCTSSEPLGLLGRFLREGSGSRLRLGRVV